MSRTQPEVLMAASACTITVRVPAALMAAARTDEKVRVRLQDALRAMQSVSQHAKTEEAVRAASVRPVFGADDATWIAAANVFESIEARIETVGYAGAVLGFRQRTVKYMSDWDTVTDVVVWNGAADEVVSWTGFVNQTWDSDALKSTNHYKPGFEPPFDNNYERGQPHLNSLYNSLYVWTGAGAEGQSNVFVFHTIRWEIDATDEVKAASKEWNDDQHKEAMIKGRARSFAGAVAERIDRETRIRKDCDVRVVKGRKVKKGTEGRVTRFEPNGQYGAYANIVTAAGEAFKFVSAENLEVIPDWKWAFRGFAAALQMGDYLNDVLAVWMEGSIPWDAVCDYVVDQDHGTYSGPEAGEALRAMDPTKMRV